MIIQIMTMIGTCTARFLNFCYKQHSFDQAHIIDLGAGLKKVRTGQDSQNKSQSGNISPIWALRRSPTLPIETKIGVVGNLDDAITCAKFQDEITGHHSTGESNFPFSYFRMGLTTVQRCLWYYTHRDIHTELTAIIIYHAASQMVNILI